MSMTVDFNSIRKRLCNRFDDVVEKASACREENGDDLGFQELADALDDLRFCVACVALCYDEHGNRDVLGDRVLKSMNPSEEEDE
jgi:hypothetical protein